MDSLSQTSCPVSASWSAWIPPHRLAVQSPHRGQHGLPPPDWLSSLRIVVSMDYIPQTGCPVSASWSVWIPSPRLAVQSPHYSQSAYIPFWAWSSVWLKSNAGALARCSPLPFKTSIYRRQLLPSHTDWSQRSSHTAAGYHLTQQLDTISHSSWIPSHTAAGYHLTQQLDTISHSSWIPSHTAAGYHLTLQLDTSTTRQAQLREKEDGDQWTVSRDGWSGR
jgi:hypothetical protein